MILLLCAEIDQNHSKMVKSAPKFHEIAKRIIEITEGTTLVGHNIDFDYRMLQQSFKRLGYDFKINTLDTIPLAKKLIPVIRTAILSANCVNPSEFL